MEALTAIWSELPKSNTSGAARLRKTKEFLIERDGPYCRYCGTSETLTIDHVIPRCMGGTGRRENLQILCAPCNNRKSLIEYVVIEEVRNAEDNYN